MGHSRISLLTAGILLVSAFLSGAEPARKALSRHVPRGVAGLQSTGRMPVTRELQLTIGLPLQRQPELDELLRQLSDPSSPNFRKYLTPDEFAARFGPSESDYAALLEFVRTNGFRLVGTHPNRVLVDVAAPAAVVERVFGVTLQNYRHPHESRDFFAPDREPTVAAPVTLLNVSGLDNYSLPHPNLKTRSLATSLAATPYAGSGPGGSYRGIDFRTAYVPGTPLTGAGQSVGLLQFDGYRSNDIATYISQCGITTSVILTNVPINGGVATPGSGEVEVCLDIEMAISMAPGLDKIIVYEGPNGGTAWSTILSKMATDNLAKQLSCSWGGGSPDATSEQIFKQMAAQGQSFFNASGDSDAFTNSVSFPADSTNITQVGGTTLTTGTGGAYVSETTWNWGNGTGSSGGVSTYYGIPSWQTNINLAVNAGSTTNRNIPDVALTGDNIYVVYSNGLTTVVGGTSCAAPLWAGYCALINQQAALGAKSPVGFLNPTLYAMANNSSYGANFHDITTGNNTSPSSPTKYYAVAGYDLCTGLGTPAGTNLINALAPLTYSIAITNAAWSLLAESATPTNGVIDPGETVAVSFSLKNSGNLASTNLIATLLPNAGVLSPSGPQSYGALAALGGVTNRTFTFTTAGACGSNILAALQLMEGTNNLGTVSFSLPLGRISGLSQGFDAVTAPALPSDWTTVNVTGTPASWTTSTSSVNTAPNAAFIADSANPGQNALVSPSLYIYTTNAQLSFQHNYSLEYARVLQGGSQYYDGGVLEIQIGSGNFTDFLTAGGSFVSGGYNRTLTTGSDNPLPGRSAWGGNSGGWTSVTARLPSAAGGQTIRLRWNLATDTGNGSGVTGWYVDSISITDSFSSCVSVFTDLAVRQTFSTNSLAAGQPLVYTLGVTNLGPQTAGSVVVTDTIPANATFVSAPGGNYASGTVAFSVGALPVGGFTNYTLTLSLGYGNVFTNTLSVSTPTPEITLTNNSSTMVSTQDSFIPAAISVPPASQTVQCSSNAAFSVTAIGTAPLRYRWATNGVIVPGATNASLTLTSVHLPSQTVTVIVTNLYGSATSSVPLTVQDTLAPTVTLTGSSPMTSELGAAFIDPGATATDACAGSVAVTVTGSVNTAAVGTNTLTYRADDGSGNTNTVQRSVVVRDTTPPVIVWSFTNLVQAANGNCSSLMTNLTGTNGVIATDLSGPVTVTQSPTNGAVLALGTNLVIFTVRDGSSNTAFSTNRILVQDLTPPVIVSAPQSRTNNAGDTAVFSVAATACTPLTYQWFFNNVALAPSGAPTLTLSNVTVAWAGNYSAVVTGSGGSSTSVVAVLTVKRLGSSVALNSSANPSGYRDLLSFTATLLPTNASGTVQFYTNLAAFDAQLLTAGNAVSAKLNSLPRGTNPITVVYSGDDTYQSATNSLLQIVTNHPPSAAPAAYSRNPGNSLNIPVTDLALGWTDVDGDPLSLAGFSVSTNGVTLTNNAGVLLYVNPNDVADQFQCGVSDGWGGAAVQTVTLSLTPPIIAIPNSVGQGGSGSSGFTLSLSGAPGYTYVLESTTNLVPGVWLSMATNTLGTNGVWMYTDTSATNSAQKFYRLKLVQ